MTVYSSHTFLTQREHYTEQIEELQHAIQDQTHRLEEAQVKRQRAEEETVHCTRETERRMDLMMERSEVVDALQQLGHLLQEESLLNEQLNGQASADRNQLNHLEEKTARARNKAKSLVAEILEVKQHLARVKARNMAAQASSPVPTGKAKRNQVNQ